ncbi:hypothetical protein [Amaricoccus sp.]|uniref:hypothetical protein n=2 Tax=Amaricoccus sp. TaxID=1872485 RepID=UPI002C1C94BC|nr:hypothetical protein [Amaricoccus sp.]HMR36561.1 hypothetical protein [Paracoccus sp. (in: a-proteobacteria)]HMR53447.1 hypothetical protein [Amaricoccus sp.]
MLTPSLALAEEAATAWRAEGPRVAVLRGYEAEDPATGAPMCQDLAAVRTAVEARLDVHETACASAGRRCRFFEDCSKQRNRDEVANAEVVVAAHQALYSGFAVDAGSLAAMIIDEGFWASALQEDRRFDLETLAHDLLGHSLGRREGAVADLHDLRRRAVTAFAEVGPVSRTALLRAGLNAETCRLAAGLEARRIKGPGLYPGMPLCDRKRAAARVAVNARTHDLIGLWNAMANLVEGTTEFDSRLLRTSGNEVIVSGLRAIHPTLRDKPILHLDATLRPGLALRVLPGLEVVEAEAAMPHMELHLVAGSFGKGVLCPDPALSATEAQRRANRLEEVVTYVRWLARRLSPVLVVTYKDCEDAFAGIPGVSTGHFNAIAGLDGYRGVRLLVVVGRPLPSDLALAPLSRALFGHRPAGGYTTRLSGIRMRDGSSRAVRVAAHEDETAEIIRAAISDDEVLQAIGRGRGVNRTAMNPLEVHVLADVALPLVHDRLLAWEAVRPDLFQRMLLAGLAVDSPGDALLLHPGFFPGSAAAEKAFQREGFGGHFPIRDLYREMSVKSAAYRRLGRGRSWQRAWWIDGDDKAAIERLEAALGHLAAWRDDG